MPHPALGVKLLDAFIKIGHPVDIAERTLSRKESLGKQFSKLLVSPDKDRPETR
jgi:hypothetical protein